MEQAILINSLICPQFGGCVLQTIPSSVQPRAEQCARLPIVVALAAVTQPHKELKGEGEGVHPVCDTDTAHLSCGKLLEHGKKQARREQRGMKDMPT